MSMGALILLGIIAMAALGIIAGMHLSPAILILVATSLCWFGFGTMSFNGPRGKTNFIIFNSIVIFTFFSIIGMLVS